MIDIEKLQQHVVLPSDIRGDALIVQPAGEAFGYREDVVAGEFNRLQKAVDDESIRHLIIDASAVNYFGSAIIGALNSLAMRIRGKDGQVALVGASVDLSSILEVMHLGTDWVRHKTVKKALQDFARNA